MLYIDKYAYCNRMGSVNPFEKFFFASTIMTICVTSNSILISLCVLMLMSGVAIIRGGIPLRFYIKLLLIPIAFLSISVLTVAIQNVQEAEVVIWGINIWGTVIGISNSSLYTAAKLFFKALGSVSCLYFLTLSTSIVDIISVLRRLKLPSVFIEIMSLVYRFIFVLLDIADKIYSSQASRLGYMNLKTGYRSLGLLTSSLFMRSYKRANDLYTALDARCYNGELRVLEQTYVISKANIAFIVLTDVCLIILTIIFGGRI